MNWAEQKLELLKSGPPTTKPYVFLTSCVGTNESLLNQMVSEAIDVQYSQMERNCDLTHFKNVMGYHEDGLRLEEDPCVSYHRSQYGGLWCYFLRHSGIEYIWVETRTCQECCGTGFTKGCENEPFTCTSCGGSGKIVVTPKTFIGKPFQRQPAPPVAKTELVGFLEMLRRAGIQIRTEEKWPAGLITVISSAGKALHFIFENGQLKEVQ